MNIWIALGGVALIVVIAAAISLVVGAVRYGTRTIHPEDYEDD